MNTISKTEWRKLRKTFRIGIDGGRKTGFCLMIGNEIREVRTLDFWKAHDYITENFAPGETEIVIESLNEKAALYARTFSETQKGRDKFAANVGSARRETSLLIERFEAKGYEVTRVKPVRAAKWTQKDFELKTGLKIRTSEHARDAARLVMSR